MLSCLETWNYGCLRYIRRRLARMHILVGPNGSGKTTFLDALAFLSRLVSDGLHAAIEERTRNPLDPVWGRTAGVLELALEARIPDTLQERLKGKRYDTVRYEIQIAIQDESLQAEIRQERALLKQSSPGPGAVRETFPLFPEPPSTLSFPRAKGVRTVFRKAPGGHDTYYSEVHEASGKGWIPSIRLGPRRSTFGNLLEDESRFPATTGLKALLRRGVQKIVLNSLLMRQASPPGQGWTFKPDGSNLPWVIRELEHKHPERFRHWLEHLATALPELEAIRVVEREDDRHAYLMVRYQGGLEVPSWKVSDGTLRLMALTIPAYLPGATGIFLSEEPENGIHPTAVETVYQSLSSVYEGQVLVATHPPILLATAKPEELLGFARIPTGESDIVRGDEHPRLRQWRGEVSLGDLFAAGILR